MFLGPRSKVGKKMHFGANLGLEWIAQALGKKMDEFEVQMELGICFKVGEINSSQRR